MGVNKHHGLRLVAVLASHRAFFWQSVVVFYVMQSHVSLESEEEYERKKKKKMAFFSLSLIRCIIRVLFFFSSRGKRKCICIYVIVLITVNQVVCGKDSSFVSLEHALSDPIKCWGETKA